MKESDLMRAIQVRASELGYRLFRNNVALGWVGQPCFQCCKILRRQRFGLFVGSSDLIGWKRGTGQFCALEVKTARGRSTVEQSLFISRVLADGGYAAIVRSPTDLG